MPLLNVGDAAPIFALPNQDGQRIWLLELHGRTVVLWFYPRADTPG